MREIPWSRRIATRILMYSLGITILSILTTGLVIVFLAADVLRENISQRNLQIARRASSEIALYMQDSLDQLETVAGILSPLHADRLLQEIVLENLVFSLDRYQRLDLVGEEASILATSRLEKGGSSDLDHRTLSAILEGRYHVSEVRLSADNLPCASVGVPVRVLGRSRAVLLAELNLRSVWDLIGEISIGEKGFAFLASRQGVLLAHPDKTLVLGSLQAARLPEPPAGLTAEGQVLLQRDGEGRSLLMVYVPVAGTDWIVGLEQPGWEAFLPVGIVIGRSLLLILAGVLVSAMVSVLLSRQLTEPLRRLAAGTRQIGMGNLDLRLPPGRKDEIGQLSQAFNEMLDRLGRQSGDLRESEARYRLLTDNVSDLIFSLDGAGRFAYVNQRMEQLTGFGREHFLGRPFLEVLSPQGAGSGREPFDRLLDNRCAAADLAVDILSREGEPIDLEIRLVRFQDPAGATFLFGTGRDITEKKRLQEQLLQTEKLSALGEIISGVAHELNNPLTTIIGFTDLILLSGQLDPETAGDLRKVVQEARRAAKIVENLLTFARKYRPEKKLCSINEIIDSVLELRAYEMNIRSIAVDRRLDPGLPLTMADPNQLRQVFFNIVNNAIQALEGSDRVRRLRVETRAEGALIRIAFADTGPGIPAKNLSRIFEPFFTTKPVGKGTGLGLSLSHGIIQEHGGRIRAQSAEGQGARFEIELPLEEEPCGPAPQEASDREVRLGGLRLLVVDDEPDLLLFIGRLLRDDDCAADLVESGAQAVQRLLAGDYDLVISDLRMPGMDGWELYGWIQANRPELQERLIFISGDVMSQEVQDLFRETGAAYLRKPFQVDDLRRSIRGVMKRAAGGARRRL